MHKLEPGLPNLRIARRGGGEDAGGDLSEVSFPYVWPDATYVKCREGGCMLSTALVTAIGARSNG